MGDDSEWMKLPTDDKIQHKVWKARVAGYEECCKLFPTLEEKSPEFAKYLGLIKKMVVDNNAIAQEKALDAVLMFVENAHVAGKTAGEVCNGIITKCLNSPRAKTKEKGQEILLMYIEIEKQEIVQDELLKGLGNKQPKVVAACVQTLTMALRGFGSKVILVKPLVKQIHTLLDARDPAVREEGKALIIEIYRWIGAALKPQLSSVKPVQVTELEEEFSKLPNEKVVQTRFLRSQQDLKAKMEQEAAAREEGEDVDDEEDGAAAEVDPYDLMDPVDILSKLPKDFYDKIEAKKWQERKEALEAVQKLLEAPKLENGDYNDLVRALKKVVGKDSNVMLVTLASKIVASLAKGLRKKFAPHALGCVDVILEKFKEKKAAVVAALKEAIDAVYATTTLDIITESCIAMLDHKTPSVKAETAAFLARCFTTCTPATLPKKLLKMYAASLLKTVNDTAPEVREASFEALGTAMKVVGEKHLLPFLTDVDNIKMAKIKECCEKAVVLGKGGKPAGEAKPAKAAAPAAAAPPAAKPASRPGTAKSGAKPGGVTDSSASSSASAKSKGGPPTVKSGGAKKAAAKGKKGADASSGKNEINEQILSDESVEEKAGAVLPADVIPGLANANWKERLAAMETFTKTVSQMAKSDIPCQAFVRLIAKKPGLKDNNFQVMKLRVELVSHLAKEATFSRQSAECVLPDLVDKIGDVKNGDSVKECLSCIAEASSLEFVCQQVVSIAFGGKNPKNQAEALNWLAQAIKEFGFKVNIKPMITNIKTALGATNPAVRTSAVGLLGVVYMYMGATLRVFFEDEKPALLSQIDAEFDKVKGEKPPAPTRGVTAKDEDGDDDEDDDEDNAAGMVNVADLVPRNDISEQITPELVTEMADKNWKVRNEALQKVTAILNEAKFITPNLGPLPEALKLRLADSNKILVTTTLTISTTLAQAMGPNIKQHVRIMGPGLVSNLGDTKTQIREAAKTALNTWVEQCSLQPFVEAEIFSDALKDQNPNLRSELLGWLSEKLPDAKKLPAMEIGLCIPHILAGMEDRNAGVRQKSQEALVPFMIHTGYDAFLKAAGKLKPASKDQIIPFLEKAKASVPAKPVKQKAAGKAGAKAAPAAAAAAAPTKMEDSDEEPAAPPPVVKSGGANKAAKAKVVGKKGAAAAPPPVKTKKNQEEEETSPPMKCSNGKEQRAKEEKALKVLKWNFPAPRQEFVDQLHTQMEPTFNKTMLDLLYHADFKKHIKAIEVLTKCIETHPDETISNLDLILKWTTLRFFETNTSVLLKSLEYLQVLFRMLAQQDYHMNDLEASSFIPYLVNKVGDPKDNVRKDIRIILKCICKVYPSSKMFSHLIDGLKSKNSKQRTECLEELGSLIEVYGINVCQPSPAQAIKVIAQQIGDRDNSVRSAALNTVVIGYTILGETVYKYVGKLSDKEKDLLDERIKRASKSRPASVVKPSSPEPQPKVVGKTPRDITNTKAHEENINKAPPTKKQAFCLDIDEGEKINYDMPKLYEVDLADLEAPVEMPKIRYKHRPPSPSMHLLSSQSDAKSAIDLVISQVASSDVTTCIQALAQIEEVLKDHDKWELFTGHVDQFLVACSLQLRMAHCKHTSSEDSATDDVIRLYKAIFASLFSIFNSQSLSKEASRDVLKDLITIIVTVLLDQSLVELDEGANVIRTVNKLTLKIVENSNHTQAMSALIKLLHENIASETCSANFLEIVMKCLWKMIRMVPEFINELNLERILQDLHLFLKAFPSSFWRSRASDTPLRTVKTIIHTLTKLKGQKILKHMSQIDQPSESELEAYIHKVLKTTPNATHTQNNNEVNGTTTPTNQSRKEAKARRKNTHDMLSEIFKKIGSKEYTKEGLNDLYDFKLKYPDADLEPFLKKSSQFFQQYIERGLKNIEAEREGKPSTVGSGGNMESSLQAALDYHRLNVQKLKEMNIALKASDSSAIPENASIEYHRERMRQSREKVNVIRQQLGMPALTPLPDTNLTMDQLKKETALITSTRAAGDQSKPDSLSSSDDQPHLVNAFTDSGSSGEMSTQPTASTNTTNLSDLRKRLEQIRGSKT